MTVNFSVTGFTPMYTGSLIANRKGLQGLGTLLPAILKKYDGVTAEFTKKGLPPGNGNYNVVFVGPPGYPGNSNIINALRVLDSDPQAFVGIDDWQVKTLFDEMRRYADGYASPSHYWYTGGSDVVTPEQLKHKAEDIRQFQHIWQRIIAGEWRVLFHAYKGGDLSLLGVPPACDARTVDPSAYVVNPDPNYPVPAKRERLGIPVQASLKTIDAMAAAKKQQIYNWQSRFKVNNVRGETTRGQLKEADVYRHYCDGGLVLSPPHYHQGSGWFRSRYSFAQMAHALVIEDVGGPFGKSHEVRYEDVNLDNFDDLFEAQRESYKSVIMSKDEIKDALRDAFTKR